MRFLHTADWHVGRSIRGRSRAGEFGDALDQVVGIAAQEGVDALLLAGDIFDHRAPAPEADSLVFEALIRLFEAGIPVVAIPGNHDSAVRLEALAKLLTPIGTTMVPRVVPPAAGSMVEIASRRGDEGALVACVPFVPPRRFGDAAALFDATEAWYQSYADGMASLLAAMADGFQADRVNILLAHLFTDGAIPGGGEHQITIGIEYAIPPSRLPPTASYVALGHVHRPQAVRGAPSPTRYAGSLLQLDFGEKQQAKSVAIVDVSAGRPAKVREVALSVGRPLLDLEGSFDEVIAERRAAPAGIPAGLRPHRRARSRHRRTGTRRPAERGRRGAQVRARPTRGRRRAVVVVEPRDQFVSYYTREHGVDVVPEDLIGAFDEILDDLAHEAP